MKVERKRSVTQLREELRRAKKRIEDLEKEKADTAHTKEALSEWADLLPQPVFELDREGNVVYTNNYGLKTTGYSQEDIDNGFSVFRLFSLEDRKKVSKDLASLLNGKKPYPQQYVLVRKDGSTLPVLIYARPLILDHKSIGVRGIAVDITQTKRAEDEIKTSLKEKEVMLREIHHRVKNNMQIMTSLLRLQLGQVKDETIKEMFRESQNRIRSMTLIHERLYQSNDLARVNFAQYIQGLAIHLFHSYRVNPSIIKLNTEVESTFLDINKAIPCGLIINELVSNTLKHAFPKGSGGEITIRLQRSNKGNIIMIVSDNGIGFPKDLDFYNPKTLGLQLVNDLTMQIDGSIEMVANEGTTIKVEFKAEEKAEEK